MEAPPVEHQGHAGKLPKPRTLRSLPPSEPKKWGQQQRHVRMHAKKCWQTGVLPWNKNQNRRTWKSLFPETKTKQTTDRKLPNCLTFWSKCWCHNLTKFSFWSELSKTKGTMWCLEKNEYPMMHHPVHFYLPDRRADVITCTWIMMFTMCNISEFHDIIHCMCGAVSTFKG